MMNINDSLDQYILEHTSPEDELLYELYRETNKKILHPRMLSGHMQGKLLEMLTRMIKPKNVLEIGTYTGYSAICIARGLEKNATLHTIEVNDELEDFILHYLNRSGYKEKIKLHIGNALEIIPSMNFMFDVVFVDGDKREYPEYLNLCKKKINPGGFIMADNVLWDGKVIEENGKIDEHTRGIKAFNKMVKEDNELENLLLPIRDGLMIVRKK